MQTNKTDNNHAKSDLDHKLMMMHSTDGLYNKDIRVEDNEIKMDAGQAIIPIGEIETLLSLPPYDGGEYETENGIVIDLEKFIEHLAFPPKHAKTLKHASPTCDPGETLSDRMIQFNKHLLDQLEADVKWR